MQENLHEKGSNKKKNSFQQSEKFSDNIVRIFNDYFTAGSRFENEFEELCVQIPQMREMYNQEKKRLPTYQKLLAEERIAPRHVYEHADIVQDNLEKRQNMVNNQRKKIRSLVDFFEDQNDRMSCHARINDFHTTFKDIFYDIREITEQQKELVKKV